MEGCCEPLNLDDFAAVNCRILQTGSRNFLWKTGLRYHSNNFFNYHYYSVPSWLCFLALYKCEYCYFLKASWCSFLESFGQFFWHFPDFDLKFLPVTKTRLFAEVSVHLKASIPVIGGCSLRPMKNRGSFVKGVDQNFFRYFLLCDLNKTSP